MRRAKGHEITTHGQTPPRGGRSWDNPRRGFALRTPVSVLPWQSHTRAHTMPQEDLALALWCRGVRVPVGLAELEVALDVDVRALLEGGEVFVVAGVEGEDAVEGRGGGWAFWGAR